MKTKLLIFLFLSLAPSLFFAQFSQQGPKLFGTGAGGVMVYQGNAVAISSDGNTAVVGAYGDNNQTGAVWVFIRSGGVWIQQGQKLVGTGAVGNARQGASVSISSDGNTIVEGGYNDDVSPNGVGAIWIFIRSGGVWTQQGSKLVGTGAVAPAFQGTSVSISSDGNTVIEGGYQDNSQTGAVWIFTRSGGVWTQLGQKLVGTGGTQFPAQGFSVAISSDGNTIIDGGFQDNSAIGALWVFTRIGNVWTQQGPKLVGTGYVGQSQQGFSVSVSSDGNTLIEGGYDANTNIGATWVFTRSGGVWSQQGPKLVGTGGVGQGAQGHSVSISSDGNTILEGGSLDSSNRGATWFFSRSNYRLINSHSNLNKPIQGMQSTLDTITVATDITSSYYISNVTITIDTISYPNDGDLEISLLHATTTDTLVYQAGGSGANFIGTVLSDSASTLISNGTPPFTGNFKPTKLLSQFINAEPVGVWILKVYDRTTGHTGTLKAWTLTLDLSPTPLNVKNMSQQVPNGFSLSQNYPNPFNPSTSIYFSIPSIGNGHDRSVQLIVYDLLGREVETLVNANLKAGTYSMNWNASQYSSGVYFYKLVTDEFIETKKMILTK